MTVIPSDASGGFLFAVVPPLDNMVQLGVLLRPGSQGSEVAGEVTEVVLYFSDYRRDAASVEMATFSVPAFYRSWTSIAIKVGVTFCYCVHLYYNVFLKRQYLYSCYFNCPVYV